MSGPTMEAALAYAALGWRAFPVTAGGKRPAFGDSWPESATTDADRIRAWWRPGSRLNIGIVAGELFDVFDVEAEHLTRFRAFMADRWLLETPIARTGRGGLHILVHPIGVSANRRLYIGGTHVGELKSHNGYIVAPPSVTASVYRWLWPAETPIAPAPAWLAEIVGRPVPSERTVPWRSVSLAPRTEIVPLVRHVRQSGSGDRNATLHWAANRAADDGIPEAIAEDLLLEAFMDTISPGEAPSERQREGRATIASAYRR